MVEYVVAIDVTRVRFPADALIDISFFTRKRQDFSNRAHKRESFKLVRYFNRNEDFQRHLVRRIRDESASSVVVTYKLPMLVPRVRFPAGAVFSVVPSLSVRVRGSRPTVSGGGSVDRQDTLAEWLRRRPAKPVGSARVGSNPTGVAPFRFANAHEDPYDPTPGGEHRNIPRASLV